MGIPNSKNYVDVRIGGPHMAALQRLKALNGEKLAIGMVRLLIRDAAKEAGMWPEPAESTAESDPEAAQLQP